MTENFIAWIDVETTGIKGYKPSLLQRRDFLLEVACLVTDMELNILDDNGYQAVVRYTPTQVENLKKHTNDYVIDMHTKTGLWDKLSSGKRLSKIDKELSTYIKQFAPEPRQAYLGGNSITLDRNFIIPNLPEVGEHLHYRSVDVTSLAILAGSWYDGTSFAKRTEHSAFSDIRESIDELKFLRGKIFK